MVTSYLSRASVHWQAQNDHSSLLQHSRGMMWKEKKGKQRLFYSLEPILLGIYPTTGVWTGLCPTSGQGGVETPWQGALHWDPF